MANETNTTNVTETDGQVDYKALYEQAQGEVSRYKSSVDKLSSENADYKRKERERMTDEEKRNNELAEKEKHYAEIERENALYKYKASLGSIIKDEKVLAEVAECYANGDIALAIGKQNAYLAKERTELEKTIKAELLQQNPQPNPQNNGGATMTKEEIMAVTDPLQRQQLIAQNINLFR